MIEHDFEAAQVLPEIPEHIASDGSPVDEKEVSIESVECLPLIPYLAGLVQRAIGRWG